MHARTQSNTLYILHTLFKLCVLVCASLTVYQTLLFILFCLCGWNFFICRLRFAYRCRYVELYHFVCIAAYLHFAPQMCSFSALLWATIAFLLPRQRNLLCVRIIWSWEKKTQNKSCRFFLTLRNNHFWHFLYSLLLFLLHLVGFPPPFQSWERKHGKCSILFISFFDISIFQHGLCVMPINSQIAMTF